MSLKYIDKRIIGAIIVDAWQKHFDTEMDPADGQWFTNGPKNNGGLYGLLTDELATKLVFTDPNPPFTIHQVAMATGRANNANGQYPPGTGVGVNLSYSYAEEVSSTHSTTNALTVGAEVALKGSAEFLGSGTEITVTISTAYTVSWTDETTTVKSETITGEMPVTLTDVPAGKVYDVVLTCNKAKVVMPYYADIHLRGTSTANFRSPVNGQRIWTVDAADLCEWIKQFESAGDESDRYGRDPGKPKEGYIRLRGEMTAERNFNFEVKIFDVTDAYNGTKPPAPRPSSSAPMEGAAFVAAMEASDAKLIHSKPADLSKISRRVDSKQS